MKRVTQGESLIGDPTAGYRFYMLQQGGPYTGVPAAGIGEDIGDMDGGAGFSGQDEYIEVGTSGQAAFRSPGRISASSRGPRAMPCGRKGRRSFRFPLPR